MLPGAGSGERYHPGHAGAPVAGFTLLEIVVVVAILGLVFGISGLALASLKAPRESEWIRGLRRARAEAIRTGVPVRARSPLPPPTAPYRPLPPVFLPDGRALGPGVDPLTGEPGRVAP
ncbi:MAG TPA: prepilin-type N-terminal cleavage/methylation domain-containing protein [Gemmatimonadales bacterium]|nr:prepilin-type N-terminal cleavage/methylation domain-containing protein [Gemmatimonadales bacterium]